MDNFIKPLLVLAIIFPLFASFFGWTTQLPDAWKIFLCYGCPTIALIAMIFLLKMIFRPDLVPDYLYRGFKKYYNRDGFCFNIAPVAVRGVAHIDIYFQNQHDQPCIAQVAFRPIKHVFLSRPDFGSIYVEIPCPSAGFGFARVSLGIPKKYQGKKQSFELGATVTYPPEGKGERLRFRESQSLRSNVNFKSHDMALFVGFFLATGYIHVISSQKEEILLPTDVKETLSEDKPAEIYILWKLGDEPLDLGEPKPG